MPATMITLKAKYQTTAGVAATGTVSFALSGTLMDQSGDVLYPKLQRVEPLDSNGAFSISLPATKGDVTTSPVGLTYTIREAISPGLTNVYSIELDTANGEEQDLSDIAPAVDKQVFTYALVSSLTAHTAATENVHGISNTAQLATLAELNGKLSIASNLSDLTSSANALANLTLTRQLDIPSVIQSATVIVRTINGTNVATGANRQSWMSYTIPNCAFAILRMAELHVDFANSGTVHTSAQTEIVRGLEGSLLLQTLTSTTDHEVHATIASAMVLYPGDTITTYVSNTDTPKVVDVTWVVEVYNA